MWASLGRWLLKHVAPIVVSKAVDKWGEKKNTPDQEPPREVKKVGKQVQ